MLRTSGSIACHIACLHFIVQCLSTERIPIVGRDIEVPGILPGRDHCFETIIIGMSRYDNQIQVGNCSSHFHLNL